MADTAEEGSGDVSDDLAVPDGSGDGAGSEDSLADPHGHYAKGTEDVYRIAYDISVRELDSQEKTLDQLRVRTTTLLAFAATAGAFLVGTFAKANPADKNLGYWFAALAGTAGFGVAAAAGFGWILRPQQWTFQSSAEAVIKTSWNLGLARTLREQATFNEHNAKLNRGRLDCMHKAFLVVMAGVAVELVLWALLVGLVGGSNPKP